MLIYEKDNKLSIMLNSNLPSTDSYADVDIVYDNDTGLAHVYIQGEEVSVVTSE